MENLIRYLKSFGITHEQINVDDVKNYITDFKRFTKEELELFFEEFVKIYAFYEEIKGAHGLDYTDMLLDFLNLGRIPKFRYVLVDELQDVNRMEADISLLSAENFIAVGDQKQAIFGFQGGSILNFMKFSDSTHYVLSENFRSTNPILTYSREYFSSNTNESHHSDELKNLINKEKEGGDKKVSRIIVDATYYCRDCGYEVFECDECGGRFIDAGEIVDSIVCFKMGTNCHKHFCDSECKDNFISKKRRRLRNEREK